MVPPELGRINQPANRHPIRVLHVIDGLAGGGSERWIWDIVRLSDPLNVQYRVLAVHPDMGRFVYHSRLRQARAFDNNGRWNEPLPNRPARRRRTPWGIIGPLVDRLPRLVRSALRSGWHITVVFPSAVLSGCRELRTFKPEVIHAHTFHGFGLGLLLAALSRRPLVYTVPCLVSQMRDAGYGWLPTLCARYHRLVRVFLTAYPSEAHVFGIDRSKTVQLDPVGDVAAVRLVSARRDECRCSVRAALGLNPDSTVLLSVGRLHRSKGHQHVVSALGSVLAAFPDAHWILLGEGEDRGDLETRVAASGLSHHVHLVGFADDPLPYYAAADVYLRTTIFEGDNFSSFYAMAMGVPVVAFDTRCETELITRAQHGVLVPVGDSERLGQAIVDLLTEPPLRTEMGERGARYASDHLDIRHTVDRICAGYRTLCAEREQVTPGEDLDAETARRS